MNRWTSTMAASIVAAFVFSATVPVEGNTLAPAPVPTVKEIMGKLHKGENAPIAKLRKSLQEENPGWDDIQKVTKEFVTLGEAMGKNKPAKGEQDSWDKLTKQYLDNAKEMDTAAQKKDKKAALEARGKIAGSCASCHKPHKPD